MHVIKDSMFSLKIVTPLLAMLALIALLTVTLVKIKQENAQPAPQVTQSKMEFAFKTLNAMDFILMI